MSMYSNWLQPAL